MNADQLAAIAALNKEKEQWKCSLLVDSFDATGNSMKKNLIDYLIPNEHVQQILQTKMKFPKTRMSNPTVPTNTATYMENAIIRLHSAR